MRKGFLFFGLILFMRLEAQIDLNISSLQLYSGPEIKNESEWTTGILTSANVFVSYINIRQFRNIEKKSNAGFLLFPGIFQLGVGALFKRQNDPTRHIDAAVGATSVLICIGRMVYRPKNRTEGTAMIMPYCVPSKVGWVSGFSLRAEF